MQKTHGNQPAISAHRKVRSSTTLNRKYVKRPEKTNQSDVVFVKRSSKIKHFDIQQVDSKVQISQSEQPIQGARIHPMQMAVNNKMKQRQEQMRSNQEIKKMSAKELKDQAIQKALSEANQLTKSEKKQKTTKLHFGFPRVALALSCAAAAVFMLVYFVNLNMPDISLKVAAMQTGFDASYPGYVPRDYSLSGITSENNKITLSFKRQSPESSFSITEEKSAWDSSALLSNYVKNTYGDDYLVVKEQGLTIYISSGDAAWVNGGVFYLLKSDSDTLTKKQIKSIAVSL